LEEEGTTRKLKEYRNRRARNNVLEKFGGKEIRLGRTWVA